MKTCVSCKESKPIEDFHRNRSSKDGRQARCKPCHILSVGAAQKRNPEAHNAANRKYRAKNPESHRASDLKWRMENPDKASASQCARVKAWRGRNPHRVREFGVKRRAACKQATPIWSDSHLINKVYEKAMELGFEVDHIVPINSPVVCGLHVHSNLQLLDRKLNIIKGNRVWPDMPMGED